METHRLGVEGPHRPPRHESLSVLSLIVILSDVGPQSLAPSIPGPSVRPSVRREIAMRLFGFAFDFGFGLGFVFGFAFGFCCGFADLAWARASVSALAMARALELALALALASALVLASASASALVLACLPLGCWICQVSNHTFGQQLQNNYITIT